MTSDGNCFLSDAKIEVVLPEVLERDAPERARVPECASSPPSTPARTPAASAAEYANASDHAARQKYNASAYTAVRKNEKGNTAISHTARTATSAPASCDASRCTALRPSRNDTDETISPPM